MHVSQDFPDRQICILGCGYVGLTLAVVMAEIGFDVLGIEIREDLLARFANGEAHFHEPGLDYSLSKLVQQGRIRFSRSIPNGCKATVFIITVGTPLDQSGRSRMDMIENTARQVAPHLKTGDMVVMRSTVKLGTTRKKVMPILDQAKVTYDIVFCPERTLEGTALSELRQLPQIVGGGSSSARVRAAQLFNFVTPTVVQVSCLETAEMIKLIDNAQRDVLFGYANEVARICDAANVSSMEVLRAGRLGYPRSHLAMPGLVGGPCLEKDSYILAEGLHELGIEPEITLAARRLNERQPGEGIGWVRKYLEAQPSFAHNPIITLAGLAFKGRPATDDLRGSMARRVLAELRQNFPQAQWRGYDAVVPESTIASEFGIEPVGSLEEAFDGASLVVLANNHPCFSAMPIEHLAQSMVKPALVYDFWNNFNANDLSMPAGTSYAAIGSHNQASAFKGRQVTALRLA
jgi:UDP-N-acetyl-D-mannosaminuronic acid dehydrogenase